MTAAVVGVILNLAVWFGVHVIFPATGHVDWFAFIGLLDRIRRNAPLEMEYCSRRARQRIAGADLHAGRFPLKTLRLNVHCVHGRYRNIIPPVSSERTPLRSLQSALEFWIEKHPARSRPLRLLQQTSFA